MKIALILLAIIAAIWFFKASRRGADKAKKSAGKPVSPDVPALDMVRCQYCEVHLPRPDAIEGKKGIYCSLEHQRRAEP